jgi:hypothetical protein
MPEIIDIFSMQKVLFGKEIDFIFSSVEDMTMIYLFVALNIGFFVLCWYIFFNMLLMFISIINISSFIFWIKFFVYVFIFYLIFLISFFKVYLFLYYQAIFEQYSNIAQNISYVLQYNYKSYMQDILHLVIWVNFFSYVFFVFVFFRIFIFVNLKLISIYIFIFIFFVVFLVDIEYAIYVLFIFLFFIKLYTLYKFIKINYIIRLVEW